MAILLNIFTHEHQLLTKEAFRAIFFALLRISSLSKRDMVCLASSLVKNPWVHGLNKSRVPSHNGGTIYLVAI